MKRDMDLARSILKQIEEQPLPEIQSGVNIHVEGYDFYDVSYHILILKEAGLIEAYSDSGMQGKEVWRAKRLTWAGHEFLEVSRDDTRWKKAKEEVTGKVGGMVVEIFKQILLASAKAAVFGP